MKHLIDRKVAGIYLVNCLHQIIKLWETLFSTVIFINDSRTGWRYAAFSFVFSRKCQTLMFTGMMVEPESAALHIGNICQTVILIYLYQSVLQILRMCKLPAVNNPCFQ